MFSKISFAAVVFLADAVSSLYTPTPLRKAGLAYPKNTQCLHLFSTKNFGWGHNWEGVRGNLPDNMYYVPTCRGGPHAALCDAAVVTDAKFIQGPNEPDIRSQDYFGDKGWNACASYFKQKVVPLKSKCKYGCQLVSPSVSNSQLPGEGLDYLKNFLDACGPECKITRLALHWHWFGSLTGAQYFAEFKKHMDKARSMFPGKIFWVSEYSAQQGAPEEIAKFVKLSSDYMNSCSWIERYAYFMASPGDAATGSLVNPDGSSLNPVGYQYSQSNLR